MGRLRDELDLPADVAARRLLGSYLVKEIDGKKIVVRIVETEAYDQSDAASHSYNGKTPRTEVMFGPAGHLYVYFTYGMHYCGNIVCGSEGQGAGVLIRAVEPIEGEDTLFENRGGKIGTEATNGPAKLCQALKIDRNWNGHDLEQEPLRLILKDELDDKYVVQTTRIGISKAQDVPWRFYVKASSYVSRT